MTNVFYLVLRRMRIPLIIIVVIYTFCTMGLAVVPGVDAEGNPAPGMGIFHAFYVISYTGTTIGFGELPLPYSAAQRLWMTLSIYLTVIGWSYSIVNVISLIQEPAFQQTVRAGRFAKRVAGLREPFYIVCGCGETGTLVCHGLDRLHLRFVVLEKDQTRLEELRLEDFRHDPPMAAADAVQPGTLTGAGLLSPYCRGVMALALADEDNQAIAVNVRLLRPGLPVLARIRDPEMDTHLGVFGGDIVINPFERFAEHLAAAVVAPEQFRLREVLTGLPGRPLPERHCPPRGHWIMCGYGRFGHAVVSRLRGAGLTVSVVDVTHYGTGEVDVRGRGTEPGTLQAAGVDHASGIVVGNKEDQRNLAIAVHARDLKPGIFVVTRQNQAGNAPLFEAFEGDLSMEPSRLVAQEFLAVITTPLLARFLERIPSMSESECERLITDLQAIHPERIPEVWSIALLPESAPAASRRLSEGGRVTIGDLLTHPVDRQRPVHALPLLLSHDGDFTHRPATDTGLHVGDEVLFAGAASAHRHAELVAGNENLLEFVQTGHEGNGGWLWQKLTRNTEESAGAGPHRTG